MSDIVNKNENLELELDDNTILSNLFGINDKNLSLIEQINQASIPENCVPAPADGLDQSLLTPSLSNILDAINTEL